MTLQPSEAVLSISLRGDFEFFIKHGGTSVHADMKYEAARLMSFFKTDVATSRIRLSSAGFYATKFGDEVRCFSCGVRYAGLGLVLLPNSALHQVDCMHMLGRDQRNVPFQACRLPPLGEIISDHDIRAQPQGSREQVIASNNGHLLWKIDGYERKQQAAMTDQFHFLESDPFYTTPTGYKMCARMYLNGEGRGSSRNLAVIVIVLLKGINDSFLPWPFRQRVSIYLINQGREGNYGESFIPNSQSSSFRRPTKKNVAFDCSLILDLNLLQRPNNGYLKNDSIVVNVRVHPDNN